MVDAAPLVAAVEDSVARNVGGTRTWVACSYE